MHISLDQMEKAFGLSTGQERFQSYLEIARRRHGELVDLIPPVFEEIKRQNYLVQRRGQINGSEHRFFLALLLNVPDRARVLEMVKHRFPDQNPVHTITEWVEELANTRVMGSSEPNVLGIKDFDDDYLFVFQSLLEGLTVEQIRKNFEEESSGDNAETRESIPDKLCDAIRNSILFKSIFSEQQ